ncbi:hypothetical protein Patl1_28968 [Pistacia atlantica]|uniref:Uncharacterized protein n=1 Tax=Pistacia atlantica TaxID=434234 RepID=A0ACC1BG80_9ROSI|nr:hypothetical protein Patl1_28968 [Pistacia atlantica]
MKLTGNKLITDIGLPIFHLCLQMILYDTPGVIEKKMHKLDSMMMKNVRSAGINADCVVVLVDASKAPQKIDEVLEEGGGDMKDKLPILLVLNKKDLIKPGEIAKKLEWYEKFTDVDEVIPDIVSEHPERFFVAEIVREKIFMQYRDEVPYACQVNVVNYKTRPTAKDFIQVEIVVEKNTQKIILIGKGGKALKLLATAARLDIEDFLQKKVYLEIEVKVKENWRQDEGLLKYYGYGGKIRALVIWSFVRGIKWSKGFKLKPSSASGLQLFIRRTGESPLI